MRQSGQLKSGWEKFTQDATNPPKMISNWIEDFRSAMVIKFTHSPSSRASDEDWKNEW